MLPGFHAFEAMPTERSDAELKHFLNGSAFLTDILSAKQKMQDEFAVFQYRPPEEYVVTACRLPED
jgi:hypothetical protein